MIGLKGAPKGGALKRHILSDAGVLNDLLHAEGIALKDIIYDIALSFLKALYGRQKNLNGLLRYLLNAVYQNADNRKTIEEAFNTFAVFPAFLEWLAGNRLSRLEEDLALRCLRFIQIFPQALDPAYLLKEFNDTAEGAGILFAVLIETLSCSPVFVPPENEGEFNKAFGPIQEKVQRRAQDIKMFKQEHDKTLDEYVNAEEGEKALSLLFTLKAFQKEINRPLYSGVLNDDATPFFYKIYIIALDENRHFPPLVRQAAFYGLCFSEHSNAFVRERVDRRRRDFIANYHYQVSCIRGAAHGEFFHELKKGLLFCGADCGVEILSSLVTKITQAIPHWNDFLYEHPIQVTDDSFMEQCSPLLQKCYAVRCGTKYQAASGEVAERFTELLDYFPPNAMPLPCSLFYYPVMVLTALLREYIHYRGVINEAELWIKQAYFLKAALNPGELEAVFLAVFRIINQRALTRSPSSQNKIITSKDLIETYAPFLEIYTMPTSQALPKEDVALMLEPKFNLAETTAENIWLAKVVLYYIDPLIKLPPPERLHEDNIKEINTFIEAMYGKQYRLEEAAQKVQEGIAAEDEHIRKANAELARFPEKPWPFPEDLKEKLASLLNARYTQTNTISTYDMDRIKGELQKPLRKTLPPEKRHRRKIALASKAVSLLEKVFPPLKKIRMYAYSRMFRTLALLEKTLDVCGWHADSHCRRKNVNCCETTMKCEYLSASGCTAECLSCKLWLCGTALSYLQDTAQNKADVNSRKASQFLKLRESYGFLCRAFNIPLKIRCSKEEAFHRGPWSSKPSVNVQLAHWADIPLHPADPPKRPNRKRRPYTKLKRPKFKLKAPTLKHLDKKTIIVIIGLLAALAAIILQ